MEQFKEIEVIVLDTNDDNSQLEIDDLNINRLSYEIKRYTYKNPFEYPKE